LVPGGRNAKSHLHKALNVVRKPLNLNHSNKMSEINTIHSESIPLATKTARYLAILIDYSIYSVFYWFIASNYGVITTSNNSIHTEVTGFPALFCFIFWFITPITEGFFGQSLGKFIFGLKVVDTSTQNATIKQCIIRHLFDLVDFFPLFGVVGLSVASNNILNQRVGDLVAKTIVVKK